jgi:hypothetical protein
VPGRSRLSCLKLAVAAAVAATALAGRAVGSEGGASFYLLGSGGPEAAMMPPMPGIFLANTAYYYRAEAAAGQQFPIGGNLVAGVRGTIAADFASALWVPRAKLFGGTLSFGGTLPFGQSWVDVSAVLTGPRGNRFGVTKSDAAFVLGDPAFAAALGWTRGRTSFQLSDLLNVPIGQYRDGELANLAFHRWANDISAAATWHDDESGWDISAKSGFTINGQNPATDYRTGTEWHIEGSVQKALTPAWSLGAQAYHFDQVTGDSGAGAVLGPFKGRVTGVGGNLAYNFKLAGVPATLMLHGMSEFDAVNRLEGHAIWLDFTIPLALRPPAGGR